MNNEEKEKIYQIPLEDILPNRFQPRLAFDEKELNELSNSIIKYGVIQPIVLRKIGDKYEIIAGERRYKASVLAGLKTIPAIINNTDDNTSAEIALLENLQRKNLTVIEEAQSFKKLLDKGFTQEEIANKLSVSQSSIANKIRLLSLPKRVQDALLYNKISERHARSLLSLNNTETQLELLDKIINEKYTVKQTEEEISRILNNHKVDDIPNDIKKYLDPTNEEKQIENNETVYRVPEVVTIEEKDVNEDNINPYQASFEDNLKKIEEEINNNDINFYDRIINNDMRNNKSSYLGAYEVNSNTDNDKKDITTVVSEVRDLVKSFNKDNVKTEELDLPDKYRITIEIMKDAE